MREIFRVVPMAAVLVLSGCAVLHDAPPAAVQDNRPAVLETAAPWREVAEVVAPQSKDQKAQDVASAKRKAGNSVYFGFGATKVDLEGKAKLRRHAARLKDDPELDVMLVGYSDNMGSRSYNLAITEQRIAAVATQLVLLGARKNQIRRYPVGNETSAHSCRDSACRQKKRRVDLVFSESR